MPTLLSDLCTNYHSNSSSRAPQVFERLSKYSEFPPKCIGDNISIKLWERETQTTLPAILAQCWEEKKLPIHTHSLTPPSRAEFKIINYVVQTFNMIMKTANHVYLKRNVLLILICWRCNSPPTNQNQEKVVCIILRYFNLSKKDGFFYRYFLWFVVQLSGF